MFEDQYNTHLVVNVLLEEDDSKVHADDGKHIRKRTQTLSSKGGLVQLA